MRRGRESRRGAALNAVRTGEIKYGKQRQTTGFLFPFFFLGDAREYIFSFCDKKGFVTRKHAGSRTVRRSIVVCTDNRFHFLAHWHGRRAKHPSLGPPQYPSVVVMGLAEAKRKQRLVGSAQTRNTAWSNDDSLPGQRMLAMMGWQAGQGIGAGKAGTAVPVAVAFKLDNKGIGAHRAEREARATGKADAWVGGGGELGSLFERLNAAAGPSAVTAGDASGSAETEQVAKGEEQGRSKSKSKSKSKKESNDKKDKMKSKKKRDDDDDERESKPEMSAKAAEQTHAPIVSASSTPSAPLTVNPRMAARARYLRAKRMVGNDLSSINEILGIASPSGSTSPAMASPVTGGSPAPVQLPASIASDEESSSSSADEVGKKAERKAAAKAARKAEKERKKMEKREREAGALPGQDAEGKKNKKEKKEKKRRREQEAVADSTKAEQRNSKRRRQDETIAMQVEVPTGTTKASDPSFEVSGGGNRVSSLSVQQYLSNKLMLRRAELIRQRRAREESVWGRAAMVQA